MDTKDTAGTTAPSVAPAKPAPTPKPAGEPEPEKPVPSVPLSGLRDDSLEGLRAALSGLSVRGPEGRVKEKEKQAVDMKAEEVHPEDGYGPSDEAPFEAHLRRALRWRRAPLISLQYPLQQPLHSPPHIQLHPKPQPLHLWLKIWALLECLTPPMV